MDTSATATSAQTTPTYCSRGEPFPQDDAGEQNGRDGVERGDDGRDRDRPPLQCEQHEHGRGDLEHRDDDDRLCKPGVGAVRPAGHDQRKHDER